jgi:cytochrome oxidase Cu insertion factor (SCO1/SenC/PrrC family)
MAAAAQMGRLAPQLSIVVRIVEVTVDPARTAAKALVTVAITGATSGTTDTWNDISELQLDLTRHDDIWLVTRVAPVDVLHK